jgi:hypothetical protein
VWDRQGRLACGDGEALTAVAAAEAPLGTRVPRETLVKQLLECPAHLVLRETWGSKGRLVCQAGQA